MYFSTSPDAKWSPMSWGQEFQVLNGALAAITITITIVLFFKSTFLKFFAVWPFFNHRYDFFKSKFQKADGHTFSFNIFQVCL
jgi:sterol 14-demethylase